jgi:hypothetical protein
VQSTPTFKPTDLAIKAYREALDQYGAANVNRDDDPEYIVRLVGQIVKASLETVQLVKSLPDQYTS